MLARWQNLVMTWRGNGLADFDEIWQAWTVIALVHLRKLIFRPIRCISTVEKTPK